MAVIPQGGKQFEKVKPGIWLGTIIDVVELGLVPSKNPQFPDPVVRTRVVWVLNYNDSNGNPQQHAEQPPSKVTPPTKYKASRFWTIAQGVLGTVPQPFDDEILVGRSNQLVFMQEGERVVLAAILPVPPGQTPPPIPKGFVRYSLRPKNQPATTQAAPAQAAPAAQPPAAGTDSFGMKYDNAPAPEVADEDIPF